MNEKHIQQVLEIEKQAQEIQEKAKRESHEIPVKAEQEAQALIAKAKADAHEEARKMIANAQAGGGAGLTTVDDASKNVEFETLAAQNFDKAVALVLEHVIGKA